VSLLKKIKIFSIFLTLAPCTFGSEYIDGRIQDHYSQRVRQVPVVETVCRIEKVPVYASATPRSRESRFGDLMVGAAIGSAIGNAISDKPGVGTLGGIIGANSAHQSQPEPEVIGYENKEVCKDTTAYSQQTTEEYSHSTVTFTLNNKRYTLRFNRYR
jgi:hypothetical protein